MSYRAVYRDSQGRTYSAPVVQHDDQWLMQTSDGLAPITLQFDDDQGGRLEFVEYRDEPDERLHIEPKQPGQSSLAQLQSAAAKQIAEVRSERARKRQDIQSDAANREAAKVAQARTNATALAQRWESEETGTDPANRIDARAFGDGGAGTLAQAQDRAARIMKNLIGRRFGRFIAIRSLRKRSSNGAVLWWCRCDCKKRVMVPSNSLLSGHSKSCGCWHRDAARKQIDKNRPQVSATLKHGGTSSLSDPALLRAYRCYRAALCRCYNPHAINFRFYGGAGVTVCDEWRHSFEAFLRDMGKPPEGTELGRWFDVGKYCKENCAWMSSQQQQEERRKKRHFIKNAMDQALLIGPYSKPKKRTR